MVDVLNMLPLWEDYRGVPGEVSGCEAAHRPTWNLLHRKFKIQLLREELSPRVHNVQNMLGRNSDIKC